MFTGIAGFLLSDIARNIATRYRQPGGIFEGGIARCHSQEHKTQRPARRGMHSDGSGLCLLVLDRYEKIKTAFMTGYKNGERAALQVCDLSAMPLYGDMAQAPAGFIAFFVCCARFAAACGA